jgi:hypothetical protein
MAYNLLKRLFWVILVAALYFFGWKSVRSAITSGLVVPQITYASEHCDDGITFERASSTAVVIFRTDSAGEPVSYRLNAPAGFYLLLGMVLLILAKAKRMWFFMIAGYHALFTVLTVSTVAFGLCYFPLLLHLSSAGNSYFTPFFTFFVLLNVLFPQFRQAISGSSEDQEG